MKYKASTKYSKNSYIRTDSFKMSLHMFLCDEAVPVIKVMALNTGTNASAWKKDI